MAAQRTQESPMELECESEFTQLLPTLALQTEKTVSLLVPVVLFDMAMLRAELAPTAEVPMDTHEPQPDPMPAPNPLEMATLLVLPEPVPLFARATHCIH
jgi:hypothetical protein